MGANRQWLDKCNFLITQLAAIQNILIWNGNIVTQRAFLHLYTHGSAVFAAVDAVDLARIAVTAVEIGLDRNTASCREKLLGHILTAGNHLSAQLVS